MNWRLLPRLVRYGLTAAILVGVYSETGKWTTTALTLCFLILEILGSSVQSRQRDIELIKAWTRTLGQHHP